MAQKVTAGQKASAPSAQFHNDLVDLVNADKAGMVRNRPAQPHHTPIDFSKVKVKNSSGGNVRRGEVLEFTGFLLTELEQQYRWFDGDTPDLTNIGWGIALRPVTAGDIDEFLVLGVCIAWVNITDEDQKYATREDGELVLQSATSGPVKILYKPSGGTPPEERECVVQVMDETAAAQFFIGQAKSESTYPSPVDWSEATTEADQVNIFPFEIQELQEGYDSSLDWEDIDTAVFTGTEEYVRAVNITGHYVPEGTYVVLCKFGDNYTAAYSLPDTMFCTLEEDLFPDDMATVSNSSVFGSAAVTVYDYYTPADRKFAAGSRAVAALRRVNSLWRYYIITLESCSAPDE